MAPLIVKENPGNFNIIGGINLTPGTSYQDDQFISVKELSVILGLSKATIFSLLNTARIHEIQQYKYTRVPNRGIKIGKLPLFVRTAQEINTMYTNSPQIRFHPWAERCDDKIINTGSNFQFRTKSKILFEYTYPRK